MGIIRQDETKALVNTGRQGRTNPRSEGQRPGGPQSGRWTAQSRQGAFLCAFRFFGSSAPLDPHRKQCRGGQFYSLLFMFWQEVFWDVSQSPGTMLSMFCATACWADLCAARFASRLLTLCTRERLVLDMTLVSALAYFVQWYWRRRLAFRNRAAPHVFVEPRR